MSFANTTIGESYQEVLGVAYRQVVGTQDFGPFTMGEFTGIFLDITRSDDGTNGTLDVTLLVDDYGTGSKLGWLDGAGNTVEINGLAAGENVRRTLQVHPTAGPAPSDDADGVFKVGTTGVASNYYRQPMPANFYLRFVTATDYSTYSAVLHFLR